MRGGRGGGGSILVYMQWLLLVTQSHVSAAAEHSDPCHGVRAREHRGWVLAVKRVVLNAAVARRLDMPERLERRP